MCNWIAPSVAAAFSILSSLSLIALFSSYILIAFDSSFFFLGHHQRFLSSYLSFHPSIPNPTSLIIVETLRHHRIVSHRFVSISFHHPHTSQEYTYWKFQSRPVWGETGQSRTQRDLINEGQQFRLICYSVFCCCTRERERERYDDRISTVNGDERGERESACWEMTNEIGRHSLPISGKWTWSDGALFRSWMMCIARKERKREEISHQTMWTSPLPRH